LGKERGKAEVIPIKVAGWCRDGVVLWKVLVVFLISWWIQTTVLQNYIVACGRKPGASTPCVLGVRRRPCQTDHDVSFSRSCDQGKSQKS